MIRFNFLVAMFLVLSVASVGSASAIYPADNGFETPDLGAGGYAYRPAGSSWTFAGNAGIAANGSAFGVVGATNGNYGGGTSTSGQAGLVQEGYGDPNTISQVITGLQSHDSVTFSLESRGTNDSLVDVNLGGHDLGSFLPASGSSFNTVTTPTTILTSGTGTLTFTGVTGVVGGDNTVFIDNVRINATPEPSSFVLCGLGAVGLLVAARRRRKA